MNFTNYTEKFQEVANQLEIPLLIEKQMEVAVGVVLNAVFLKLYKKHWANPSPNPLTADSRIFFSVWINDQGIRENKIYYNIHALKLRKLKGYVIESRKFADAFRTNFAKVAYAWPNVSIDFGPLTLMEGWTHFTADNVQHKILTLAENFLEIDYLIDNTLDRYRR